MRALLLFNPHAAGVSPRVRDVISHALASEMKLDVAETMHRGHATELARDASQDDYDAVIVLGGDGTLNEAVNGLIGTDTPVIPIPGGGTNVFARTLGLPKDPIEATSVILERIQSGVEFRRISLGRVNGRAFMFCAGAGYDGAVVRAVEHRSNLKRRFGEAFFVAQAVRVFFFGRTRTRFRMDIETADTAIQRAHLAICCNSSPYTYLGAREFRLLPDASFDSGLDLIAATKMPTLGALRLIYKGFTSTDHDKFRWVHMRHDVGTVSISSPVPVPYQVDGEYAGEASTLEFESIPDALSVIAG